jgi:hypothetical protein
LIIINRTGDVNIGYNASIRIISRQRIDSQGNGTLLKPRRSFVTIASRIAMVYLAHRNPRTRLAGLQMLNVKDRPCTGIAI